MFKFIYLIVLLTTAGCNLLKTYDQVSLMIGIQAPIYGQEINVGIKLDLKDQAINKQKEIQKDKLIQSYVNFLKWKRQKGDM